MQLKTYTIPIIGGEGVNNDMNTFIRSKKILQIEKKFIVLGESAFWCICISYLDDATIGDKEKVKPDYEKILDAPAFKRFLKMREIRKQLALEEGIPAYAVFTDEELSNLAKPENLTLEQMKTLKNIGEKKVDKYGQHFLINSDEKSE